MFERLRTRIRELVNAPEAIARAAAPRIEAKLRADATTRRGNVPSFGPMGDIPIRAEVRATSVVVTGPGWVIEKAAELGQVAEWADIEREEARRILGGD